MTNEEIIRYKIKQALNGKNKEVEDSLYNIIVDAQSGKLDISSIKQEIISEKTEIINQINDSKASLEADINSLEA